MPSTFSFLHFQTTVQFGGCGRQRWSRAGIWSPCPEVSSTERSTWRASSGGRRLWSRSPAEGWASTTCAPSSDICKADQPELEWAKARALRPLGSQVGLALNKNTRRWSLGLNLAKAHELFWRLKKALMNVTVSKAPQKLENLLGSKGSQKLFWLQKEALSSKLTPKRPEPENSGLV